MKDLKGKIKAVFFAPDIHYGPAGTIGGSDFPYMLEKHVEDRYGVPAFIMHRTVDMDSNPVSSTQFGRIRDSMEKGIKEGKPLQGGLSYTESVCGDSQVSRLGIGGLSLVTLTRAPRVTEDVAQPAAAHIQRDDGVEVRAQHNNRRPQLAARERAQGGARTA